MQTGRLIPMDRPRRLLAKVGRYTSNPERFFADTHAAVTLFLDALPHADAQLLLKMLPLLGCAGDDRVLWPLFDLISSGTLDDPIRSSAAIHLGLAASASQDPLAIRNAMIENLNHPDAAIRSSVALSLGWKGNAPAIKPLAARLCDPDPEVREAVVASLSSVEDDTVLALLEERINRGTKEERRVIFLHLWRFHPFAKQVETIYLQNIADADANLRLDMMIGLAMLPLSPKLLDLYRLFLSDKHAPIRYQVVENLFGANPIAYQPLNMDLQRLLNDEDDKVRQAAIKLFAQMQKVPPG